MGFSSRAGWWDYPLAPEHHRSFLRGGVPENQQGCLVPGGGSRRGALREASAVLPPECWRRSPCVALASTVTWTGVGEHSLLEGEELVVKVGLTLFSENWGACHGVWVNILFRNILSQKLGSLLWACACIQGDPALSTSGLEVTTERTTCLCATDLL